MADIIVHLAHTKLGVLTCHHFTSITLNSAKISHQEWGVTIRCLVRVLIMLVSFSLACIVRQALLLLRDSTRILRGANVGFNPNPNMLESWRAPNRMPSGLLSFLYDRFLV